MTVTNAFQFDRTRLLERAQAHREEYANATPFPHIALDDFCPEWILDEVLAEFSSPREEGWMRLESETTNASSRAYGTRVWGPPPATCWPNSTPPPSWTS